MEKNQLTKITGWTLIVGGLCMAIFWLLIIPFESFAGVDTVTNPLQQTAQVFHLVGAILLLYGFIGLYIHFASDLGNLGLIGIFLTILGSVGVIIDAVIGLVIAPVLAEAAPQTIESDGELFTGAVLVLYIVIFAVNMTGQFLLGLSLYRNSKLDQRLVLIFMIGSILSNLPPSPSLHLVLVGGGTILGLVLSAFGFMLMRSE